MRFKIKRRLLFLIFGVATFLAMLSIGAAAELSNKDAKTLKDEFSTLIEGIDQYGIFLNNVKIALAMFIPAFGAGFGAFSGLSTGMVFSALVEGTALQGAPPLVILATPFGIMEVFSYGLAMSRSGMLVVFIYRLVRKKIPSEEIRPYLIQTGIEIAIVVIVLFAAAFIEWYMIQEFGNANDIEISV